MDFRGYIIEPPFYLLDGSSAPPATRAVTATDTPLMFTDVALDLDQTSEFYGDLYVDESGNGAVICDADVVLQRLIVRFGTFKNSWFDDPDAYMDWYASVFTGKAPDKIAINAAFVDVILSTPGIDHLAAPISYEIDKRARQLKPTFTAVMNTGQQITFTIPMGL